MGQVWRPNKDLSLELRVENSSEPDELNLWSSFLSYAVVSYVIYLRGSKGLMLDLESINRHKECNDGTYFVIRLMGRVKGESHNRCHLIPRVN